MFSEIVYILESTVCMLFFYLTYRLLMRRDTNFQMNRLFLLLSLFLSAVIPFIEIKSPVSSVIASYNNSLDGITIFAEKSVTKSAINQFNFDFLLWIYYAGAVYFFIRLLISLNKIFKIIRKSTVIKTGDSHLVLMDEPIGSFSFFSYIFIDRASYESERSGQIICHETAHAKNFHSVDIILIELMQIVLWFNPVLQLIKKSIVEQHEYEADRSVLRNGYNLSVYQKTLANCFLLANNLFYANKFNNSLIKMRFKMMNKMKSSGLTLFKGLIIIPLTAILIFTFSCSNNKQYDNFDRIRYSELEKSYIQPEKYAEFPGGWKAMYDFIDKNFKVPESLKGKNVNGKVHVGFIVESDGSVSNVHIINAKMINDDKYADHFGYGCDEEALKVVRSMPKWNPAVLNGKPIATIYTLPFIIGDKQKVYTDEKSNSIVFQPDKNYKPGDTKLPEFGGEDGNISKFVLQHLKYPEEARKNGVTGKVIISFDVTETGETENIKVIQGVGGGCTEEAIKVIRLFPKWKPAMQGDKPVKVTQTLPFMFKLK